MKTKIFTRTLFAFLIATAIQAQDITTVNAKNSDISDNLDLRAVASIFGDSKDLEDFERRLNDPKVQISNLDLNNDGQVDYLRVIETTEGNTHLIVIQSVLERDVFQDVATVEVEKDSNNQVQVQVVGDVYMYGQNYIYEPVYVHTPIIYSSFWVGSYRPYYSPWYWNYYPVYYTAWHPFPIYRYRRHIHTHINVHNHYNYVNVRRSDRAVYLHSTRRSNGYERLHPNRSFTQRNNNVTNRYELENTRKTTGTTRTGRYGTENTRTTRNTDAAKETTRNNSSVVRNNSGAQQESVRGATRNTVRTSTPKSDVQQPTTRQSPTRVTTRTENVTVPTTRKSVQQNSIPVTRSQSVPRNNTPVTPRNTTVRSSERQAPTQTRQAQPQGNSQRESTRGNSRR